MDGNLAMNSHSENMSEKDGNDMADHYITLEWNKLIAKFMGGILMQDDYGAWGYKIENPHWNKLQSPEALCYHSSWDWLMPVVEKISKIKLPEAENEFDTHHPTTFGMLNAETGRPMFRFSCCGVFEADTLIEAVWMACVDFIKLYKPY